MKGIEGKTAVVTGAAQGNGLAIARGLASAGARVAICDLDEATARAAAREITASGATVIAARADVSDSAEAADFAARVERELGPAAILVNNAGIIRRTPIDDPAFDADWDAIFRVNVDGIRNMVRAFLPQLSASGGSVINLGSIMSVTAGPALSAYAASKGAVLQFTKALAHDLAPLGVRVNAIAPGVIATPMTKVTRENPEAIGRFMAHTPLGRVGEPDELAGPVLFLASDLSSYVTGALLPVDGGYLAA
ncbi:glucose 1-dehydrogenase [Aquamicrobium sp. LC103]|uniref:SDR family NAD(P)-dependent oxidoreductase n=1 Tax=Aquamicrobium sp. LC103 TaxID=1120658 RepID=UPI000A9A9720|nr:glucose 1-dehydrogenase [Aquamicrobium sp. LC103]